MSMKNNICITLHRLQSTLMHSMYLFLTKPYTVSRGDINIADKETEVLRDKIIDIHPSKQGRARIEILVF